MELDKCPRSDSCIRIHGVIGGLISIESGFSIYMILATAGISGAMGSVALTYFWERLTGVKNAKS